MNRPMRFLPQESEITIIKINMSTSGHPVTLLKLYQV